MDPMCSSGSCLDGMPSAPFFALTLPWRRAGLRSLSAAGSALQRSARAEMDKGRARGPHPSPTPFAQCRHWKNCTHFSIDACINTRKGVELQRGSASLKLKKKRK